MAIVDFESVQRMQDLSLPVSLGVTRPGSYRSQLHVSWQDTGGPQAVDLWGGPPGHHGPELWSSPIPCRACVITTELSPCF